MIDLEKIEMPYIIFFKDGHSYWKEGKKRIESINGLLKHVTSPFDGKYWSTHSMLKEFFGEEYSKHFGTFRSPKPDADLLYAPFMERMEDWEYFWKKKELKEKWELKKVISQWRGTMFHDYMEKKAYEQGKLRNPFTGKDVPVIFKEKTFDNESLCRNLYDLEDGAYLELLVFDPQYDFCGQADMVFIETRRKKRYISINDWKTNQDKPDDKSRGNLGEPLSHLKESNHMKYALQINLYALLLQRHGFIPDKLAYTWARDYNPNQLEIVEFSYMEKEMHDLLNYLT